jgi:hypothetical protein
MSFLGVAAEGGAEDEEDEEEVDEVVVFVFDVLEEEEDEEVGLLDLLRVADPNGFSSFLVCLSSFFCCFSVYSFGSRIFSKVPPHVFRC